MGRPALVFDQERADLICEEIATSAKSVETILSEIGGPSHYTVWKWIREVPSFAAEYARAKEAQADFLFNQIVEIADKPLVGIIEEELSDADGGHSKTVKKDNVERSRQMIEARKWVLGKLKPKKYGDKIEHEHTGGIILQSSIPTPDYSKRLK